MNDPTANMKTERLTDLALAYKKSRTLVTALELGIFSKIADGHDTVDALALALELDPERVDRLVTVCKAIELVREVNGKLENFNDVSRYLVQGSRSFFGDYLHYIAERDYVAWTELTENLTSVPSPQPDDRTYLAVMDDPKYAREFTEAGYQGSIGLGHKLAREFDFSPFRRWLDIAGGSGCYSIAACERYPELTSVILDLPNVLPVTHEYVEQHGLGDRIATAVGNFFEPGMPTGFDLASFITPLQGYMPDRVIAALSNARNSLNPGGTILVIDYMLTDEKDGPTDPAFVNLFGIRNGQYLNRVNTGAEWSTFLESAGYVDPKVSWFTPHQLGLVTARKPG
ncbi:MAG: methyltransferase [Pseudomonadota bacterium]